MVGSEESPPTKESKPNFFSGRVQLVTLEGIVELDIKDSEVIKGKNILEANILPDNISPDQTHLELTEATHRLGLFYQDFYKPSTQRPDAGDNYWELNRLATIEEVGQDSIETLFPPDFTIPMVRAYNSFRRNGIRTKADLIEKTSGKLPPLRGIGAKTMKLIKLMKDVIKAEQKLKAISG